MRINLALMLAIFLVGSVLIVVPSVAYADVSYSVTGQWMKYPGNPVLSPTLGSWDADYVIGPKVLYDGHIFRMWYNGGNSATGTSGVGYATSNDGVVWAKYGVQVLSSGPVGAWDSGEVELGSVVWNGTLFLMWYRGSNTTSTGAGAVGLATSTNGTSWVKYQGNPILRRSRFGLDQNFLATPYSISPSPRSYDMWYSGEENSLDQTLGLTSRLLYATSLDGVDWAKWPGAVLSPSTNANAWDSGSVYAPSVIYDGTTFELWYTGMNKSYAMPQIGFATSSDGANWMRSPSNPVLVPGGADSWDSAGVEQPNVVVHGNTALLYYDGFSRSMGGRIGLAENSQSIAVPEFPFYSLLSGLVLCVALVVTRKARIISTGQARGM